MVKKGHPKIWNCFICGVKKSTEDELVLALDINNQAQYVCVEHSITFEDGSTHIMDRGIIQGEFEAHKEFRLYEPRQIGYE